MIEGTENVGVVAPPQRQSLAALPSGEVLVNYLGAAHRLANSLNEKRLVSDFDINISHWVLLFEVKDAGVPLGRLMNRVGVSRQRLHTLLKELEDLRLVKVETSITNDKRNRTVTITDSGTKALASFNQAFESQDFSLFGPAGVKALENGTRIAARTAQMLRRRSENSGA
ncbi:MarR family winged helix-turn-helix transcriptional regulator [Hyphomonas sp.]|uniref:MarR family winged helix-turn-helix transcriptional regulator n=1 Tax=Alphaproteobacteria TaxID=28211 RepID=UPI003265D7BC